jgi:hypothetical protein
MSVMYFGVKCFDANKTFLADYFPVKNNFQGAGQPGWTVNNWNELTGWFKGRSSSSFTGPAPDPTSPMTLPNATAYIAPIIYLNWAANAPISNIMEVDDIRIEAFDEEQYTTNAPNGTFSGQIYQVFYPYDPAATGDAKSSTIGYYWTYTQGLVKADQFAVFMNDGTAYHVERVKALPGPSGIYELAVFQVAHNKNFYVSVEPEAIGASGVTAQAGYTFPSVLPNPSRGSAPGGYVTVGRVDWAGGNIWYDSVQYRNNAPPSNGISAAINITNYQHGSGGSLVTITNILYTQGPNIATHVAVLLKTPIGTVVLSQDMVVSVISFPLPSSYTVPINLPNDTTFTVAVAACAECKNGRIYNGAFQPKDIPAGFPWIHGNSAPTGNKFVRLGHPDGSDYIELYQPMRMVSPDAYLPSYSAGGTYQGGFSGDANGVYVANGAGKFFHITQGGLPNFGFNMTNWGGGTGCIALAYANAPPSAPSGGGVIWVDGYGAQFVSAGNTRTTFGAAGPHCAKCGYDFWKVASKNPTWGASLYICGWCGAVYKSGPKSVLRKLTKEQRSDIIQVQNVETEKPERLVRRRDTRPRRKRAKNRVRSPRRRALRIRHKNTTA